MKQLFFAALLLAANFVCFGQTKLNRNEDSTVYIYDLSDEMKSTKLHEGENLITVIEKKHAFYLDVRRGEPYQWFFKETDGKKYYAEASATTSKIVVVRPTDRFGYPGPFCIVCVDIPGWGHRCAIVYCGPTNSAKTH